MKRSLPLLFARRYLSSRKSLSVINIITVVSSFTVAIPVMAMVLLLSVFNGFDSLIKSMYRDFDPDILITRSDGRFFDKSTLDTAAMRTAGGVCISFVMEENALLEYQGRQFIATMRGVDSSYAGVVPIEKMVVRGEYKLSLGDIDQALLGQGLAYNLYINNINTGVISVYMPRRGGGSSLFPVNAYNTRDIYPSGIFALDGETDGKYIIVPLSFAQKLLELGNGEVSGAMVRLGEGRDHIRARREIARAVGDDFRVQTRYQQKESLYRIMQYEKWGIYFIILMVLVIASFSTIGSLVMIIIDKGKDIDTLYTLGADTRFVRKIFINEGMLISGIGAVAGLVLGIAVCLLQQRFGMVKMAGSSFLIDSYPVEIKLTDLVGIVLSVWTINYIISYLTTVSIIKKRT